MKKRILAVCLIATLILASLGGLTAFAQVSLEECDRCFQTTMNALLDDSDVEGNKINAVRKPVYDITLETLGYVYEYEVANGEGYAIIICDNGEYVAQEVFPDSVSPYKDVEDLCVYVNNMTYLASRDGELYDINTGAVIGEELKEQLTEIAIYYENDGSIVTGKETVEVYYTSKSVDGYETCHRPPQFYYPGLAGGCAAVAGANLIGYYDRFYEDLIPNHSAGLAYLDYFYYNLTDSKVLAAIDELYSNMNGNSNGITEANFKSGLTKYCNNKGLSVDYTSVMSWGKLSYNSVKTSLKANKPIVLFLSTYNTCYIYYGDSYESLSYSFYSGNHVMVGFAYRDVTYNTSSGAQNTRFIYVSTGLSDPDNAYFNIDYNTNINSAYGVNIH